MTFALDTETNRAAAQAIGNAALLDSRNPDGSPNPARALNALGALAGFTCQMAVREGFIKTGRMTEEQAFATVFTKTNGRYYFGDLPNHPLLGDWAGRSVENPGTSVWALVKTAAAQAGAKTLPDIHDIARHTAQVIGSDAFGIPRVPERYRSPELPLDALRKEWPATQKQLTAPQMNPFSWHWVLGTAIQNVLLANVATVPPDVAAQIVMEAAIPMAKIDPATLSVGP